MVTQNLKEPSLLQQFERLGQHLIPAHVLLVPRAVDEVEVVPYASYYVPEYVKDLHFGVGALVFPDVTLFLVY